MIGSVLLEGVGEKTLDSCNNATVSLFVISAVVPLLTVITLYWPLDYGYSGKTFLVHTFYGNGNKPSKYC
jgi:hypothetical protein